MQSPHRGAGRRSPLHNPISRDSRRHDGDVPADAGNGRRGFLLAGALGLLLNGFPARAASSGRVVFGFTLTPSTEDLIATILSDLQPSYQPDLGGRPVFMPGNSGALAMSSVANAPPDGASVLLTSSGAMTLLPFVSRLPVDPAVALQPVAGIGEFPYAFVVGAAVPEQVMTMADYLRWVQANPERATYGLPGRGTAPHFIGTEIARISDVNLQAVGYKGLLPVIQDVAKGDIPAAVTVLPGGSDTTHFSNVRTLAVSSARRWPDRPDVPTLMELGLAESPTVDSLGFFVATGTPAAKVAELREGVRSILQSPATMATMRANGLEPMSSDASYAEFISRDRAEWQVRVDRRHFGGGQ